MKILEQLWYDGLHPSEDLPLDRLCREYFDEITENEEKLLTLLPEEVKEAYEKCTDSKEELAVTDRAKIFAAGFRLGAKIMLEVMEEK